jgi:hypothetical protein
VTLGVSSSVNRVRHSVVPKALKHAVRRRPEDIADGGGIGWPGTASLVQVDGRALGCGVPSQPVTLAEGSLTEEAEERSGRVGDDGHPDGEAAC